jgi:hypothetical protein
MQQQQHQQQHLQQQVQVHTPSSWTTARIRSAALKYQVAWPSSLFPLVTTSRDTSPRINSAATT